MFLHVGCVADVSLVSSESDDDEWTGGVICHVSSFLSIEHITSALVQQGPWNTHCVFLDKRSTRWEIFFLLYYDTFLSRRARAVLRSLDGK